MRNGLGLGRGTPRLPRRSSRGNPGLAREYERIKRGLATTVSERADYNRGKESFIREVVARHPSP
ncbi:hypothetical protein EAO79_05220 [Plantibacter sp. PA-3-X8]|nr:hypothetical protein EAO79_05220 [Plantibacter sp. PA-3-X8]